MPAHPLRAKLTEWLGAPSQVLFLQGDICCPELMIETESDHWT
jgi:hypothetical protein